MNFKQLEIYGFKSFADRTIVKFDGGITGIVGPNGSGKSNFSDAIKWVLGEQSPKALRGKNMQDVIFNGTQRRGSMSYCEVTLVFDNTNKLFPTLEFDEVRVTRKLYRTNVSDYYINDVECRLKDIKDIIRDTGLGKDGYSIIGQGKVAEIIDAKPESRRTIFEEAAGISKFKARKVEAENKLLRTREHIERLQDIIHEVERRLGPLEKQSADARRYNDLYSSLIEREANHYLFTCENNEVVKKKILLTLEGIAEEINKIELDIISLDKRYSAGMIELGNLDTAIGNLQQQRTDLLVDREKKLGQGALLNEKINNLKAEQKKLENNIARYKEQILEKKALCKQIDDTITAYSTQIKTINTDYAKTESEYNALVDEIINREQEMERNNRSIMDAISKLTDIKADMGRLSAELKHLKQKAAELAELIDSRRSAIEIEESEKKEYEEKLFAVKKDRDEVYKSLVETKKSAAELRFEQNVLNDSVVELSNSIASYKTKVEVYNRLKENYEGFQAPVRQLMAEAKTDHVLKSKIEGVVAELIKVPKELETAIEVSLGAAMNNIVTMKDDDVKYAIDVLKRKRLGYLTFLPINTIKTRDLASEYRSVLKEQGCVGIASELIGYDKKYYNVMSNLLGSTVIVDNYNNAKNIAQKYRTRFRIVTQEGDVFSTQGSISGGSRKSANSNLLGQEREIEQINTLYNKALVEYNAKSVKLVKVKEEYEKKTALIAQLNDSLVEKENAYVAATNAVDTSTKRLEGLLEQLADYTNNYDTVIQSIGLYEDKIKSVDKLEGDLNLDRNSIDDIKAKAKEEFDAKRAYKDSLYETLTSKRMSLVELEGKLNALKEETNRLSEETKQTQQYIDNDESILATINVNIKRAEGEVAISALSQEDKDKLNVILENIKVCEERKAAINEDIVNINEQKDSKNKQLVDASTRKTKEEASYERLESQFTALVERLLEDYKLDHEGARRYYREDYNDSDGIKEIASIKREINGLGTINAAAIEDYEAENERYTTLTGERDDLIKAEEDLLGIIKDLSNEMKEIFDNEFAKISRNFEETFKEIFGGGKGQLVLDTDAEDPLSAGIEIYAQPPGKKLGQISLFSGGEMALTAIAILFAILKSRPMPFCVLDEIEAALDESNARLFAKYLKKFVKETQFIVITHRKPTMEQADRLFGVTMEEKGVSKVVSVELSEAVKSVQVEQAQ